MAPKHAPIPNGHPGPVTLGMPRGRGSTPDVKVAVVGEEGENTQGPGNLDISSLVTSDPATPLTTSTRPPPRDPRTRAGLSFATVPS